MPIDMEKFYVQRLCNFFNIRKHEFKYWDVSKLMSVIGLSGFRRKDQDPWFFFGILLNSGAVE